MIKNKICITGAHSTGKTTLINSYVAAYPDVNYYIIKEKAREVIDAGFPLGREATIDSYLYYMNQQLKAEIESGFVKYDLLFSDRSIVDGAAHPLVNNRLAIAFFPKYFLELFENVLHFQKSFFDAYVYIPIEFAMSADVVRPNDELYREEIDFEIKRLLSKHIKMFFPVAGTLKERMEQLNDIIQLKLK